MKKPVVRRLFAMIFVPIVLLASMLVYSNIISWNLFSIILFWFAVVPLLTHYTAKFFNGHNKNMSASINGLLIFYVIIGVLIYFNYEITFLRMIIMSIIPTIVMIFLFNSKEISTEE